MLVNTGSARLTGLSHVVELSLLFLCEDGGTDSQVTSGIEGANFYMQTGSGHNANRDNKL